MLKGKKDDIIHEYQKEKPKEGLISGQSESRSRWSVIVKREREKRKMTNI